MNDAGPAAGGSETISARAPKKRRSRATLVVGILLTVAIFYWFGKGLVENWDDFSTRLAQVSMWIVAVTAACYLIFFLLVSLCYHNSLRLAGAKVRAADSVNVYLASQLGKYVPGKVLYVAGQIGLASWLRISVAKSTLGFTAHHIFLAGTGLLIASPLLGIALKQATVAGMVILSVLGIVILASGVWIKPFNAFQRKRGKVEMETFSPVLAIRALVSAGLGWVAYGAIAAVLAASMMDGVSLGMAARVAMAAVAAWLFGFLSFIAPAGLGVREGALVLLTRSVLPEPVAMGIALLMRLIHTTLQVPIGALALGYSVRRRPVEPGGGK